MAKKRELTGESFTIRRYGTGWTVNGTRYYMGDEKIENFEEVYEDRVKLIRGLAVYLGLRPTNQLRSELREGFCIALPKSEKVS